MISIDTTLWSRCTASTDTLFSLLESSLNRGKDYSLTMNVGVLRRDSHAQSVLALLVSHAPRWHDVYFWSDVTSSHLGGAKGHLGCLEKLNLSTTSWKNLDIFRDAPRLREFTFDGRVDDLPDLPWAQIRTLAYAGDASLPNFHSLSILSRTNNIDKSTFHIDLRGRSGGVWPLVSSGVRSSALLTGQMLDSLTLPSLEMFAYFSYDDNPSPVWPSDSFLAFADRSRFSEHLALVCTSSAPPLTPRLDYLSLNSVLGFPDLVLVDVIASRLEHIRMLSGLNGVFQADVWWYLARQHEMSPETLAKLSELVLEGGLDFELGPRQSSNCDLSRRDCAQLTIGHEGVRSDDTATLKRKIPKWLTKDKAVLIPPLESLKSKTHRGFAHLEFAQLLTPMEWLPDELTWTEILDGTRHIKSNHLPAFLFPLDQEFPVNIKDLEDDTWIMVLDNTLKSEAAKAIFMGPDATLEDDGYHKGCPGNGGIIGLVTFTPRTITWVVAQVYFALSSKQDWYKTEGDHFSYEKFFWTICSLFDEKQWGNEIIVLWIAAPVAAACGPSNLECVKAARARKRAAGAPASSNP
ncbi:hypothetical protein B0H14DRAFT_2632957 [Mycena olivaceomarginata]|nr:hypothetical protein B0H14DRAFT_2632957 [Mycena olivaceomarginata]